VAEPGTGLQLLGNLADKINQEHAACERAARDVIKHAIRAGDLLTEAKAAVPHGQWLPWLREHFAGSPRIAQQYMQLAGVSPNTREAVAHLPLREALAAIATRRPSPPPPSEPPTLIPGHRGGAADVSREEAERAHAELEHEREARERQLPFPAPGTQRKTWQRIEQALEAVPGAMQEARPAGLVPWARAEALRAAARHAEQAAELLRELAKTVQ
jgi:hypothetical protein